MEKIKVAATKYNTGFLDFWIKINDKIYHISEHDIKYFENPNDPELKKYMQ